VEKKMSKIEELLKNEKVEWKRLGEIFDTRVGYTPSKSNSEFWSNGVINWFTIEDLRQRGRILNFANVKISEKAIKKQTFKKNSIILSIIATIGEYALIKTDFVVNQQFMVFTLKEEYLDIIDINYMTYYFSKISEFCRRNTRISNVPTIDTDRILKIQIPIPSLEIQEKIVKTLDKFTKYVAELQTELQLRLKQYEYYRNMLLSEEYLNKISDEMKSVIRGGTYRVYCTTLGDIGEFIRGNGLQKNDFKEKGNPVIHYGQIYTKYKFSTDKTISYVNDSVFAKLRKAKTNDILMATTSENIEDVCKCVVWLGEETIGYSGDMHCYSTKENSKYIAYYFQTIEFQRQKEMKVTGTKLIRIHADDMAKFKINLPPLEIQNHIVTILDKFQDILSGTKGMLPKEIELRQKQYEYYREKLLTFDVDYGRERERESL